MSYCIGYLYIGAVNVDFCIGFLYIVCINYNSITISGGSVCCSGMDCFSGMGYVVYGDRCRITNILSHRNHIALIVDSDISNIGRFTQYAASCE